MFWAWGKGRAPRASERLAEGALKTGAGGLPAMDTLPPHTTMGDRVRGGIIGRTHRSLHLAFGLRKGIPPSAGAAENRPVAHSPGIPRQAEYFF